MHAETAEYCLSEVGGVLSRAHSAPPRGQFLEPRIVNGGGILFRPEPLAGAATTLGGRCSAAMTLGARL